MNDFLLNTSSGDDIFSELADGDYFVNPIPPYLSQFASRELVSDFLDKRISTKDDSHWAQFGFEKLDEYEFWAPRLCGLICVKMILDAVNTCSANETVATLTNKAISLGGYKVYDDSGEFIDKGWFYAPLIELAKEYNVKGKVCTSIASSDLCYNVLSNIFTVASVHPKVIRFDIDKCPDGKKGGHLVVIIGFKWAIGKCVGIYIHNPTGREKVTQEKAFIPIERFNEAFAQRGFILC